MAPSPEETPPRRKLQMARKSTAKRPRNLAPRSHSPPRRSSSVIEVITLDSSDDDDDQYDISCIAEIKPTELVNPNAEPVALVEIVEVDESSVKAEPEDVKHELPEGEDEREGRPVVTLVPEPVALTEPGTSSDSIGPRSRVSPSRNPETDQLQRSPSPPPQDEPLDLIESEDENESQSETEAQRTLEEAFAERRKIQEARRICREEGIPLLDSPRPRVSNTGTVEHPDQLRQPLPIGVQHTQRQQRHVVRIQVLPGPSTSVRSESLQTEDLSIVSSETSSSEAGVVQDADDLWNWEEIPPVATSSNGSASTSNAPAETEPSSSHNTAAADALLSEHRQAQQERWRQQQERPLTSAAAASSTASVAQVPAQQSESQRSSEEALRLHRERQMNRWRLEQLQQRQQQVRAQPGPSKKKKNPDARANQEIDFFQNNSGNLIPEDRFAAFAGQVANSNAVCRGRRRGVAISGRANRALQGGVERYLSGMFSDSNALAASTGRKTIKAEDVKLALRLARGRRNP